jgi:hypothetical protein
LQLPQLCLDPVAQADVGQLAVNSAVEKSMNTCFAVSSARLTAVEGMNERSIDAGTSLRLALCRNFSTLVRNNLP